MGGGEKRDDPSCSPAEKSVLRVLRITEMEGMFSITVMLVVGETFEDTVPQRRDGPPETDSLGGVSPVRLVPLFMRAAADPTIQP